MLVRLIALFTIIPVIEIYVLLEVGSLIGAPWTIALIFLTGIAGAWLARSQGFDLLRRIQSDLGAGRVPASELIDGVLILIGGVLLLTPGFCTDLLGFGLLTPPTRNGLKKLVSRKIEKMIRDGQIHIYRG